MNNHTLKLGALPLKLKLELLNLDLLFPKPTNTPHPKKKETPEPKAAKQHNDLPRQWWMPAGLGITIIVCNLLLRTRSNILHQR